MQTSFTTWLEDRTQRLEVPETTKLLQLISQAGSNGVRLRDLRKAIKMDRDVLDDLLAAMVAVGQAVMMGDGGGESVYYAF